MQLRTLADWLSYQEQLHPNAIDLGLERLNRVLARLGWNGFKCPVVTVGGTNGKGSCVALLDSILSAQGYRVGVFTSPHLIRYNERIHVAGKEVSDDELVEAFERIETARGDISITFFEFNALAAFLIFQKSDLDAVVLEVGMGGRLDAVNAIDPDVAIVTSIGLDHCDWLGKDLETIAGWKAGIFRTKRPAIFGAREMPETIASEANRIGAQLQRLGVDFDHAAGATTWDWRGPESISDLPRPGLPGAIQLDNASTALTAIHALRQRLPVSRAALQKGLTAASLPGRFQIVLPNPRSKCEWIFDVAHNPAAAKILAHNLKDRPHRHQTLAVCGMFADKDIDGVIAAVADQIDRWIVATVSGPRAIAAESLSAKIKAQGGVVAAIAASVHDACDQALALAQPHDRVIVFGSFHTVGPALEWVNTSHPA